MSKFLFSMETLITVALLIISCIFMLTSLQLPAGEFDPLGAGTTPAMVAGILMLLCVMVLIRKFQRRNHEIDVENEPIDILERTGEATPKEFVSFLALLILYVLGFHFQLAHFIVLTTIFVFIATLVLGEIERKNIITAAIISTVLSTSLFLILTKFFVIRLPGAF